MTCLPNQTGEETGVIANVGTGIDASIALTYEPAHQFALGRLEYAVPDQQPADCAGRGRPAGGVSGPRLQDGRQLAEQPAGAAGRLPAQGVGRRAQAQEAPNGLRLTHAAPPRIARV